MSDSVIPNTVIEPAPSAAVVAKRARVSLAAEAVHTIGQMPFKGAQAPRACELMAYLDAEYARECAELDSLIASEILQTPVTVEGGSKISLAESH